jgi:hypothetical protein
MYSFTLSCPRRIDRVGGHHLAPAALPPGITRYPLYRRLGLPHGRSGHMRKISPRRDIFYICLYLVLHCSGIELSMFVCIVSYCMLWIFPAGKIRRLRSGANPRCWVPEACMQTPIPPKPQDSIPGPSSP